MHKDLSLPKSIVKQLRKCAKEIVRYNGLAKEFSSEMDEFINKLKASYDTKHENLGGCPLKLHKIPDERYDLDDIFKAILNKDVNLTIEYNEQHLSTSLHTINLKELDSVRKYELCEDLRKLRSKTRNLTSFKYLDKSQKNLNSIIELLERKLGNLS